MGRKFLRILGSSVNTDHILTLYITFRIVTRTKFFIIGIPMQEEHNSILYPDYSASATQLDASYYTPSKPVYTENWQTPASSANQRGVTFQSDNHLPDGEFDTLTRSKRDHPDRCHSVTPSYTNNPYVDMFADEIDSQDYSSDVKYSTGSADSGVHSHSPYQGSASPSLAANRHRNEHTTSIQELDHTHTSVGSKTIRNETYV